jgi:molecular chaperone DnaJ
MKKDYYLVLKVPHQATFSEICSAYRHRARELHPDVAHPFLEVQEAYSVLADPARRAEYDRFARGTSPPSRSPFAEPLKAQSGTRLSHVSVRDSFDTVEPSAEELLDRIWSNFIDITRPKAERIASLTVDVPIPADEALMGGRAQVFVPARIICPSCRGQGALGPYRCWRCDGRGAWLDEYPILVDYPPFQGNFFVQVPLDTVGIHNFYLTVRFRVTDEL